MTKTHSRPEPRSGSVVHADKLVDWLTNGVTRRLILMIGLPASGKSTLSDRLKAKGVVYLNRDSIREELYGDATVQGDYREVSGLLYKRLEEGCDADAVIVADNTHTTVDQRKGTYVRAFDKGYTDFVVLLLDVPLEECIRRNKLRKRQVPESVIRDMHKTLYEIGYPRPYEGKLVVLRPSRASHDHLYVHRIRPAKPYRKPAPRARRSADSSAPATDKQ